MYTKAAHMAVFFVSLGVITDNSDYMIDVKVEFIFE